MILDYPAGKQLALRVKDTQHSDHFTVFVNHRIRARIVDDQLHQFPILV